MTTEDRMTVDERYKYLRTMKARYVKTSRKEREHLLGEMEQVTGLYRKSLIRLLKSPLQRRPRTKQRGRTYRAEVDATIGVVLATLDYPCAERLTPNLAWMVAHLAAHQELAVSDALLKQLERSSISTVERRLRTMRPQQARRPRKPPRAPTLRCKGYPWNAPLDHPGAGAPGNSHGQTLSAIPPLPVSAPPDRSPVRGSTAMACTSASPP